MKTAEPDLSSKPRGIVVLLVGPTAVGKTAVSLQLARRLGAEIVSADSRLFYRGMDVGTAKPTPQERSEIPHHLIDIAEPDETVSLATFQTLADESIASILSRNRLPLVVGGSGQYIRAMAFGWRPPRVPPDERLRTELSTLASQRGPGWLHAGLRRMDPPAADRIDPRNTRRTVRALEVIFASGRPFSGQRGSVAPAYHLLGVGLHRSRTELYDRIDARIDDMWKKGLLEETRRLLNRGCGPELPSMSAIGYSQCIEVLQGKLEPEQARADMRSTTRAFVRRQSNWFRSSDLDITWFEAGKDSVVLQIERFLREAAGHSQAG